MTRRQGIALVGVMICLYIVGMLGLILVQANLARGTQARSEEFRLQSRWLADSALERGRAALLVSPDYRGEIWEPAADVFHGRGRGRAEVTIVSEGEHQWRIAVVAFFPHDDPRAVRTRRIVRMRREFAEGERQP